MEQEHLDLQETDFGYSLKNILAPTQKEYIFALLGQVQSFMNRLRWKTFFILNPETAEEKETYGFRTQNRPPHIPQLDLLQSNLIKIISNIKFKKGGNNLQTKMRNDLSSVRQDPDKLLVAADKSQNLYKMSPTREGRITSWKPSTLKTKWSQLNLASLIDRFTGCRNRKHSSQ